MASLGITYAVPSRSLAVLMVFFGLGPGIGISLIQWPGVTGFIGHFKTVQTVAIAIAVSGSGVGNGFHVLGV